ncbi:cell division protein ZipA [Reinekea sp.]|jgi:cell division protein ZipA|uniref:cell division protein ZipA n=1 Tax=Reinekea sp. TaxID=1970455 RepID=UPI002A80AB92|nr:cell division protein ZipA [Reinekea sp.]
MELREIIVGLGVVAIIVILIDGLRRMKIKIPRKSAPLDDGYEDPEELARKAQIARELPNGGARVVREMSGTEQSSLKQRLNLRERVPMLMERVEVAEGDDAAEFDRSEAAQLKAAQQSELDFTQAMAEPDGDPESGEPEQAEGAVLAPESRSPRVPERDTESSAGSAPDDADKDHADNDYADKDHADKDYADKDYDDQDDADEREDNQPQQQDDTRMAHAAAADPGHVGTGVSTPASTDAQVSQAPVEELVIIHVMAKKDAELSGSAVLELLLTAGLRHGPMDIFHYRNPQGYTEFSLANCIRPGTFNPDSMNQVNTPGVTLFMQLPTAANTLEAFDHMYEMARYLAKHLEADMLDEDHNSVTLQRLEYYREKLRTFVRSKMIRS